MVGVPSAGSTFVQVQLWVGSRLVGTGEAHGRADSSDTGSPAGAGALALERAVGQALAQALATATASELVRGIVQANGNPARAIRPELTIAYDPEELMVTEWDQVVGMYAVGLDALWLSVDGQLAWSLPGEQLRQDAANGTGTMLRLAARLGVPAASLADARRDHDVRLGRATATRLVSAEPGEPPTAVMRRHAMRLPTSLDQAREAVGDVAGFIVASAPSAELIQDPAVRTGVEAVGLSDHFDFDTGQFRDVNASPAAQALAAWALVAALPLLEGEEREGALRASRAALQSLPRRAAGEADASTSRLASAIAVATTAGPEGGRLNVDAQTGEWVDAARARVMESINSATPPIDESRAPEVYAFAVVAANGADADALDHARAAIARAWDELPPSLLPSATAWLVMAEQAIDPTSKQPPPRRESRDRAVALLCSMQLSDPGAGARQFDLIGGIVLGHRPADARGSPRVGAASALPAIAMASAQAPEDRISAAMGFLAILPVDAAGAVGVMRGSPATGAVGAVGAVGELPWSTQSELGHAALVLRALTACIQALESAPISASPLDSAPDGDTLDGVGPEEKDW